jgi:class 3 adenylate cyclase
VTITATQEGAATLHAAAGSPVDLAIAFTDLADFTAFTEAEGDDAASRLLIAHHCESAAIVRGRGGRVVRWLGDGLMLAFPSPEAAVLACFELAECAPLRLRAGVHRGTVLAAGDDVVGRVVNIASRAAASANGGELVVTDVVRNAIGDVHGVTFDGPYARHFKGIAESVPVYLASRG